MIESYNLFIPAVRVLPVQKGYRVEAVDEDDLPHVQVGFFSAWMYPMQGHHEDRSVTYKVVRYQGFLYKIIPPDPEDLDEYGNYLPNLRPPYIPHHPDVPDGSGGNVGPTPHSLVTKYQVKVFVSNKHGYVEIPNPKKAAQQHVPFMLVDLVYINKTRARDIDSIIDFPPRFNGDLLWLEGKHFYSPNEDSYYYYAGAPDVKVSCYYRVELERTVRKMRANNCGYLLVTETANYKHDELYTVAGYHLRFGAMLIFSETEVVIPDVVGEQELPPGVTPPVPPPPAVREKFKIGPFEFLLPFGDGGLGPHDSEWIDAMGDEAEYARLKAQFLKSQAKTVKASPICSKTDDGRYVYNPVNVYNRRTFYFPASDTYYAYVGDIEPTGSDNKGPYYEVVYHHYPKSGEYAQTELVASGLYVDAQTFDQMILNS